jgi:hypothetical protein
MGGDRERDGERVNERETERGGLTGLVFALDSARAAGGVAGAAVQQAMSETCVCVCVIVCRRVEHVRVLSTYRQQAARVRGCCVSSAAAPFAFAPWNQSQSQQKKQANAGNEQT